LSAVAEAAYFDDLETRAAEVREADLIARLAAQVAHARANAPYYAAALADVDPASVTDRASLAGLPLVRKRDLIERQRADPPFGGLVAAPVGGLARVFMSPGPIYEPQGRGGDFWRLARALHAAGIRRGDLLYNTFAYHLTPAGAMFESAARAIGCPVIPGGTGNSEQQVRAIHDLRPVGYAGVPDFLKILLDKAVELGLDAGSVRKALVSGAALPGSLRDELSGRGVSVLQCYATADLGLIAYETAHDGAVGEGMIVDEGVIVEIVRPGTGDPVPDGEVGEVVVTGFNAVYPLIRFATGDLSAVLPGRSACGRTNIRLRGWLGRADQTAKVRGMFVHPEQIAAAIAPFAPVARARLVVGRQDERDTMVLRCEAGVADAAALTVALEAALAEATKLRGTVEIVAPGTLPNDGKVIDDTRPVG
jgi:phenylacetate-CoA ligase